MVIVIPLEWPPLHILIRISPQGRSKLNEVYAALGYEVEFHDDARLPVRDSPAMTVSLVYETHSLTEDNHAGVATGWLPGKLSMEGRRLAAELGERRGNDGIAAVFCSDLRRAVETANIAFGESDIPVLLDWRLRECNYGLLNGAPVAEVARARRQHIHDPFPGGQSYNESVENTRSFLADVARGFHGRRVCVIAHVASKWALDVLLHGARLEDLVEADFGWREGWEYLLPSGYTEIP